MIIGTAGHIDHGKTALIRALTGIDADRLAEEKKRGLTIDLGFAYQRAPDGRELGFVDVPGHERFVPNMLSGALAVDAVLFVIAADDGPMPQSAEHLTILDLLGLDRGVIALTKSDRVDAARLEAARAETRALVAGTGLAAAEILPVSSHTGAGIDTLRPRLEALAESRSPRAHGGCFRLAVDRAFSVSGTGTVVTGTVHSGRVGVGDQLRLAPAGLDVRVRAIRRQNHAADRAVAGDRCALNLTGRRLERRAIKRGDWVLAPAAAIARDRLDASLRVPADAPRALAHWTPVHVHIGAADIPGRVAVLSGERIAARGEGMVQLLLDRPVPAFHGDRFVLRDQSATHTLAGGRVLDAFAPGRGRRRPERLRLLDILAGNSAASALDALLTERGIAGLDADWFERVFNHTRAEAEAIYARHAPVIARADGGRRLFAPSAWQRLTAALLTAVDQQHQREPNSPGLADAGLGAALRTVLGRSVPAAALHAAREQLIAGGRLARRGPRLCLPEHRVHLSAAQHALWRMIGPRLAAGGLRPPRVRELAAELDTSRDVLRQLLRHQVDAGALWEISAELFYPPASVAALAAATERAATAAGGRLTVKSFREGTGASRNVAVEWLEFFDRTGLTARAEDGRRLRGDPAVLYGRPHETA